MAQSSPILIHTEGNRFIFYCLKNVIVTSKPFSWEFFLGKRCSCFFSNASHSRFCTSCEIWKCRKFECLVLVKKKNISYIIKLYWKSQFSSFLTKCVGKMITQYKHNRGLRNQFKIISNDFLFITLMWRREWNIRKVHI